MTICKFRTWACTFDFVCYRSASEGQFGSSSDADASDRRLYVENVKRSEREFASNEILHLIIQIFRNLLDDSDVLTMKLFRNEKLHDEVTKGFQEIQSEGAEDCVLRQLFVTVSAKIMFAVKQHVSQLRSSSSGAKHKVKSSSVDEIVDDAALFKDIPDSFLDISPNSYPLVITFRKLLMMLDGTVGVSFFERFPDLRDLCRGQSFNSRPVALQSLLRAKEVTYEKFCAVYWPHFNDKIRRLDPSRVFTEIMSHVKGGLPPADGCEGKLDRPAYVSISEGRVSTLSFQRREEIYDAFEDYEKMKMKNGEFDLADLVNDLHCRLLHGQFAGNVVDFVYIDEVQDLTMRQISLFKYICRNVDGGFVFSGDTAQTIARGIDFRFEDIRSLFYKEFLMDSMDGPDIRMEKGCLSKIFHLSQNFRTHAGILKLAQSVVDLLYHFPLIR
ncbi:TPR and ankyrin repeat-containing protein 1-like [Eucalyptus grandis]|uniref:TPR and ankyrin repeat-containing protein 1-like n=1 Tax=Eucalyptus grandis TaxID=71139 RepID=UPI00192E8EEF|nr:TPR and ankyrin repeat-containing protein 1-like [Eucalyptus grandis]